MRRAVPAPQPCGSFLPMGLRTVVCWPRSVCTTRSSLSRRRASKMSTKLKNVLHVQDPTGLTYFLGTLHASEIKELTMVPVVTRSPPSTDDPELLMNEDSADGYQRAGEPSRMQKIADFVRARPGCVIPPVLLSCRGNWKFEPGGKNSSIGTLVAHDLAAVVDGQHRLGGLWRLAKDAGASNELRNRVIPFMAVADMSLGDEKREFVDVNSNQRGVKKSLLKYLDRHGSFSGRAATALMEDEESVFKGRIDEQKKREWTLILFGAAQECVDEMFGRALQIMKFDPAHNTHQQESALEFTLLYWRTVKEALPAFWADMDRMPAVGVHKSKEHPGTTRFRYRLLEETGLRAFSRLACDLFAMTWMDALQTPSWDTIAQYLTSLADNDRVELILSKPKLRPEVLEEDPLLRSTGKAGVERLHLHLRSVLLHVAQKP